MRVHKNRVNLSNKRIHGGNVFKTGSGNSDKVNKLAELMNGAYLKEQPKKKYSGKTFML